jgi:S1-C subfamily serine protease
MVNKGGRMKLKKDSENFVAFLAIIATSLAAGAFVLAWQPSNHFFDASPKYDGFVPPRQISDLIDETQNSTVLVICSIDGKDSAFGTGWAIDSKTLQVSSKKTTIITNYHVIEDCVKENGKVSVAKLYKDKKPAEILNYDKKGDLAVLTTKLKLPTLELSENPPYPGYWVMALGSAAAYEGSVAFGNVLNVTNEDILITNNISEGNSGGALIDNEGKVIGVVTWGMDYRTDQYNGASILDVACVKILKCQYKFDTEKTWFDYNG